MLQTAYVKILEGRARFGGRSSFRTWLFSVVRVTARELRRRSLWTRLGLLRLEGEPPPPHPASAERVVDASREARAVRDAVAALPTRQRQVVELVFVHDLSVREAAQVLGVSQGSAMRHYDRAKKGLNAALAARGIAP